MVDERSGNAGSSSPQVNGGPASASFPEYPPSRSSTPGYPPPPPHHTTQPAQLSDPYRPPAPPYGYGVSASEPLDVLGRPFATWWQRVVALLIDTLVIWVPGTIILGIVDATTSTTIVDTFTGSTHRYVPSPFNLTWAVVVAAQIIYLSTLDGHSQTVGKRVLGIAVRAQSSGQPIGFGRALGRWFIYVALFYVMVIPGLLNALSPLWNVKRQAWHDRAVGSVVVRLR